MKYSPTPQSRALISPVALMAGFLSYQPAYAQESVVIQNGQTETEKVILDEDGDSLTIEAGGAQNAVSVLDAALVFGGGPLVLVSLGTIAMIIFIPLLRVMLVIYVLLPVVADRPPAKHAAWAFSLSEALRPWSMAEIFAIGCAVALIKVADLAQIAFGPAFWMFCILTVLVVVQDSYLCRWSVWNSLEKTT